MMGLNGRFAIKYIMTIIRKSAAIARTRLALAELAPRSVGTLLVIDNRNSEILSSIVGPLRDINRGNAYSILIQIKITDARMAI